MISIPRISVAFAATLALVAMAPAASAQRPSSATPTDSYEASREPARAFMKVDVRLAPSTPDPYVGQAMPVTIRAYFLAGTGVAVNGLPRIASDSVTLSELSEKPIQAQSEIRGLPYTTLTWRGVLTAVKAGPAKTSVELPVDLSYRDPPRARSANSSDQFDRDEESDQQASDPFASLLQQSPFASDPFFAQMFKGHDPFKGMFDDMGGAVRRSEVTLLAQMSPVRALDLPPGRPPNFTGAVGSFEISAALPDQTFRVGEPTELKMIVRGQGSFARLSLAGLSATDDFNTYGVPSTFTPGPMPTAGEKIFTQTIAPRRAGELTIPALTLAYFDPGERRYVTRRTAPMNVTVAVSASELAAPSSPSLAESARAATAGSAPSSSARPGGAIPFGPDVVRSTLTPCFRTRRFWWLAVGIALAAVALAIVGRASTHGTLGRLRAAHRLRGEVGAQRRIIDTAVTRGDAALLFGAARKALQARLGVSWSVPSDAISGADVVARMGPRGKRIHEVFERAYRLSYSANSLPANEDLRSWQALVFDELRALEVTT
jgi:hypothetical protein